MKCLLCSFNNVDENKLLDHYISFHKIDEKNWFFKNLFSIKKNSKILKKSLRCEDFIYDRQSKVEHDFLNHFSEGKIQPYENKPIEIKKIYYSEHKDSYNFFDSEKCVTDFLLNCKYNFKNTDQNKSFKCSFTIQNQQKSAIENNLPSFDIRYWSISVHESVFFNDFIFFALKSEVLNRVIHNGLSGSSWFFYKFASLSLKVLEGEIILSV